MPPRDKDGKQLSGCAKRKLAAAKRKAYAERVASGLGPPSVAELIEDPPDDTTALLPWALRGLTLTLWQVIHDRALAPVDRYRMAGQLAASMGAIKDKAQFQTRLSRLARFH